MEVNRRLIAHNLLDRSAKLLALGVNGWRPVQEGWQEHLICDHDTVDTVWRHRDYNIGVACGGGLLVADVDDKPGKHGSQSLAQLGLDLEDYDTFTVATPTTGRHFYWQGADVANSVATARRALLGPDIDVRSKGGYVVGPGSYLPDGAKNAQGGFYRVVNDALIRPAPECVTRRLLSPLESMEHPDIPVVDLDQPAAIARAIEWLTQQPLVIERQGADFATYRAATLLKDFGLSEPMTTQVMLSHYKCAPRNDKTPGWIATKVANAYLYGRLPPGVENPEHVFAGIHIPQPPPLVIPGDRWFRQGCDWRGSVEWLYHQLLPTRGVCLLTGASQSGKTFVALDLAHSLSTGKPFFGVEPEMRGGSIILAGEAYGSVKMRMAALGDEPGPISVTAVGRLADRETWATLLSDIKTETARIGADFNLPVRLLVLDTLSASGILDDENDNAKAATVLKTLADVAEAMNALFVILHHPPKTGGGQRGASAIPNNADYVMEVLRDEDLREVMMAKSRDAEQRTLGSFTLHKVELERDAKGRAVTTMRLSVGKERIKLSLGGPKNTKNDATFINAMVWAMEHAAADITWIRGQKAVTREAVRQRFYDTASNPKNISRSWENSLTRALERNTAVAVVKGETQCLAWKEIKLDPSTAPGDGD